MIYILAGKLEQARIVANVNKLDLHQWKYLDRHEQLRGIASESAKIWLYGNYWSNSDYELISNYAKMRGIEIVYKNDLRR